MEGPRISETERQLAALQTANAVESSFEKALAEARVLEARNQAQVRLPEHPEHAVPPSFDLTRARARMQRLRTELAATVAERDRLRIEVAALLKAQVRGRRSMAPVPPPLTNSHAALCPGARLRRDMVGSASSRS